MKKLLEDCIQEAASLPEGNLLTEQEKTGEKTVS